MRRLFRASRAGAVTLALFSATACETRDDSAEAAAALAGALPAPKSSNLLASAPASASNSFNPRLLRRFKPARAVIAEEGQVIAPAQIELGRLLFYEPRISRDRDLSCNSCHALDHYGVDGLKTSRGYKGQSGGRNAPTVYHAAGQFEQFWDGRVGSIEAQALAPILNPIEMAAPSADYVVQTLKVFPEYQSAFAAAFPGEPDPITFANVGKAIGAFERQLTTRSRWDDYLEGKADALTAEEITGLRSFTNLGCMVCHTGEFLGGSMYEKVGVVEPWPNQADQGRYQVTHEAGDRMLFKVPTLRNVAETAPYFHDGSIATLEQAVRVMAKHQLGIELRSAELEAIVAWLRSLTGRLPAQYLAPPPLPRDRDGLPSADGESVRTASVASLPNKIRNP
jgi:cytochrome c peroxidase